MTPDHTEQSVRILAAIDTFMRAGPERYLVIAHSPTLGIRVVVQEVSSDREHRGESVTDALSQLATVLELEGGAL